jgi:hypothetical protein
MLYSVFRPDLRRYDYYEDGTATAKFPHPKHISGRIAADKAGWPLPGGSRKVGEGLVPRGQIARTGLGGDDGPSSVWTVVGLALLGYGLWRVARR